MFDYFGSSVPLANPLCGCLKRLHLVHVTSALACFIPKNDSEQFSSIFNENFILLCCLLRQFLNFSRGSLIEITKLYHQQTYKQLV